MTKIIAYILIFLIGGSILYLLWSGVIVPLIVQPAKKNK